MPTSQPPASAAPSPPPLPTSQHGRPRPEARRLPTSQPAAVCRPEPAPSPTPHGHRPVPPQAPHLCRPDSHRPPRGENPRTPAWRHLSQPPRGPHARRPDGTYPCRPRWPHDPHPHPPSRRAGTFVPWLLGGGRGRQEAAPRRGGERAGRAGFAGVGPAPGRQRPPSPCRSASTTYGHPLPGELLSNHPHPHLFALRTVEALHKAWRAGWSPSPRSPSTPESRRAR